MQQRRGGERILEGRLSGHPSECVTTRFNRWQVVPYLSAAGAGGMRRIGAVPRPPWEPAPTLTGKGTACWTGPDGERMP